MYESLNDKRERHWLEAVLPFLGVLAPYKISIVPVTAIVLFVVLLSKMSGGKIKVSARCGPFLLFFGYLAVRDVLHMMFSDGGTFSGQVNRLIEDVVLYALILLVSSGFNEDKLYKWWKIAGVIFGAGMVYHVVQLFVFRQAVMPIPIIPGYVLRGDALEGSLRPTSFFAEPASYVSSMMPLLFLSLKRRDLKWAFISTFLIVVSTSTVGVLLSALLWILFVLFEKKSVWTTVASILFVCIFVVLFLNLDLFSDALEKLEMVAEGESTFGSRVQAPFEVISLMDPIHLPFGNNVLDPKAFVLAEPVPLPNELLVFERAAQRDSVFLNTIAHLIFRYGIVGLCLFLGCFKNKLLNKDFDARMYAIMLFVASFGQGNISEPGIPMLLLLLYTCNNAKEQSLQ